MLNKIKDYRDNYEEGFTLIELLVVILIIGILAAIAIPVFLNQRKVAIDSSVESDVKNSATGVESNLKGKGVVTIDDIKETMNTFSSGNIIAVNGTYENGYCIQGYNPNGNRDSSNPVAYDSLAAGMLKDGTSAQACPTNVLNTPIIGGVQVGDDGGLGDTPVATPGATTGQITKNGKTVNVDFFSNYSNGGYDHESTWSNELTVSMVATDGIEDARAGGVVKAKLTNITCADGTTTTMNRESYNTIGQGFFDNIMNEFIYPNRLTNESCEISSITIEPDNTTQFYTITAPVTIIVAK